MSTRYDTHTHTHTVCTLIMSWLLRKHVVGQNLLFGFWVGFCLQRDQSLGLQTETRTELYPLVFSWGLSLIILIS